MRRGKMKKWRVTAIALLMVMIFATPMSGLKVQAEESIQSEMANVDITIANKEVGYNSFGVQPLTTLFDCEIILAFTTKGLEMTFTTSAAEVSSVIGVKDIKVQQKMWYGWKTVMTSDGAENHDEEVFGGGLIYPDAVSGKTYRVTCIHYANYDVYEEVFNDTGAFKFVLSQLELPGNKQHTINPCYTYEKT